jgi:hypothetical protein
MSDREAVGTLASLARLLLRRPDLDRTDRDRLAAEVDEYSEELRKLLAAIVAEHEFAQSPASGLAVVTAAMLVRDEMRAVESSSPSPIRLEASRAIERALASV